MINDFANSVVRQAFQPDSRTFDVVCPHFRLESLIYWQPPGPLDNTNIANKGL
jgi:hypothetical protein